MELDFLPNLPKSNLDDRTYRELVEDCILRIPRYCPEWTNYNPSDPGITLVELFAGLTHQMLQRFNQVPRRHYVTFLEMLGIRLQPPASATTEVTFYLVSSLPQPYTIPASTQVATLRTSNEEAVIFQTEQPLVIGNPRIQELLSAPTAEAMPTVLRDRLTHFWTQQADGRWNGPELSLFNEQPQTGNCFYLVFDPDQSLAGNVLALTFYGQEATPTGINPNLPPRRWEAWDGSNWQPVLLAEEDDQTQGFSFSDLAQRGGNPLQGADVLLHCPLHWPVTQFTAYRGYWLRCVCTPPQVQQPPYSRSPLIVGMTARSVGGTALSTQCELIEGEMMGLSDGSPGQQFRLQGVPVLERREDEYLLVTPPTELPQRWQEVADFSQSQVGDRHYVIDSATGMIQFGPLVREPHQLPQHTQQRSQVQRNLIPTPDPPVNGSSGITTLTNHPGGDPTAQVRQYGAIPPRGATLQMHRYRTGGGQRGNVQAGALRVLKSAVPYVTRIFNHIPAHNGADGESLDQAAIRVPQLLRSRDRAITPADFEHLALQAGEGAIARVHHLSGRPPLRTQAPTPGIVQLLIVPQASTVGIERAEGIAPEQFQLNEHLRDRILNYLDERRPLGIQVQCLEPNYVGVSVQTEIALKPEYNNTEARREILYQLKVALYRFLNPLTGGLDGHGWPLGQPVYPSDIIALFQQVPGIRYLGAVQLFELRLQNQQWRRELPPNSVIDPGPLGLICSWSDMYLRSHHVINIL